ncbi:maleylpyruvate isomerase N-terminal domain-containing protein [Nonomuraea angiospora]|uniref:maleylpyruvate isomerase N-terminal domain-containing protein n=1 Tax=Nonomuraea angiospora TaxID=46172 RepID=UPI003424222C
MDTPDESLALLARALDQLGTVLSHLRQEQAGLPTPCRSWNVRQLLEHVVDEVDRFAASTATGERGHGGGNPIGNDVSEDLARATGQSTDLDPELGAAALAFGLENLPPEIRGAESAGHQIGAEITVPDDAPLYDRLAAFCGRNPFNWFDEGK